MQTGIDRLPNLRVLLMSNNKLKDWSEVERLSGNGKLEELLLMGNPLAPPTGTPEYRIEARTPSASLLLFCNSALPRMGRAYLLKHAMPVVMAMLDPSARAVFHGRQCLRCFPVVLSPT